MTELHVGLTGTRRGLASRQADVLTDALTRLARRARVTSRGVVLHHGDCVGVDAQGAEIARALGYRLVSHPPLNPKLRAHVASDAVLPAKPYLDRDRDLVDCTVVLLACPAQRSARLGSGTWFTIDYARSLDRPRLIIHRDGDGEVSLDYLGMIGDVA
jgi:hypothetical protein